MKTKHARSIRKGIKFSQYAWGVVTGIDYGLKGYTEYRYIQLGKILLGQDLLARTAYEMHAHKRGWVVR